MLRAATRRRRPRPAALAVQLGIERLLQLGRRGEHQPAQPARVEHLVVLVVRQPHQPRPRLGVAGDHHDLEVAGAVIDRQRAQHRPRMRRAVRSGSSPTKLNPGLDRRLSTLPIPRILLCSRMKSRSAPPVTGSSSSPIGHLGPLQRHRRFAGLLDADAQPDIEEVRHRPVGAPTSADRR